MREGLHTHFDECMKLGRDSIAERFGNQDEVLRGISKLLGIGWTFGNTRLKMMKKNGLGMCLATVDVIKNKCPLCVICLRPECVLVASSMDVP